MTANAQLGNELHLLRQMPFVATGAGPAPNSAGVRIISCCTMTMLAVNDNDNHGNDNEGYDDIDSGDGDDNAGGE